MTKVARISRNLLQSREGTVLGCVFRRCFGQPASQTHPHLIQEGEVTPGISKLEFFQRRQNLMAMIARNQNRAAQNSSGSNHIVVIPSASKTFMTHDIPYPFRQNTDFLYLSGFLEPNSVLVLEANALSLPDHKSVLFVPKKDPHRELWDGPRSGIDGSLEITGVDQSLNVDDLGNYLKGYLKDNSSFTMWYDYRKPAHLDYHNRFLDNFMKENRYGYVESPRALIQALRVIKSPAERTLMQKSCDIASKAFIKVMKMSHPQVNEAHLYAKMDFECRINGADMLAYPPVVAGGNRANTIHYINNNQLVCGGELVLMDAGCECHGFSSDITRTWPVSGEFSGAQWELYEAVLEVQQKCIDMCRPGDVSMETIYMKMLSTIGKQLQRLNIVDQSIKGVELQRIARSYCPHHVSHYLGMDVHDTDEISRGMKLLPGMVITIEPGIYIPNTNTDVPPEFRGIGIRIEDDVLITEGNPIVLTANCPKCPDEIESLMKER